MKYIKLYEKFILEYLNISDIYTKYYSDIDKNTYNKIVKSDPTSFKDKVGIYVKWLINLYKHKSLKLEDLYKATEYLSLFHKFKHKLPIKDINKIKTLPELFKLVEPFSDTEEFIFDSEEERKLSGQFKEVFRNNTDRIIVPLTLKASKYFGKGTQWCTINEDMFEEYTENQDINNLDGNCLYIIYPIDSKNSKDRLQFSFSTRQFMNINDTPIDIYEFLESNKDIYSFFKKHFNCDIYLKTADDIIEEWCKSNDISIITDVFSLDIEDNIIEEWIDNEDDYVRILSFDIIISNIEIDENAMDNVYVEGFRFICKNEILFKKFISFLKDTYQNCEIDYENFNDKHIYKAFLS